MLSIYWQSVYLKMYLIAKLSFTRLYDLIFLTLLLSHSALFSQNEGFRSPVDYTTRISGSFGEPRTRHFHAGLDYKRNRGVPFDTIRAVKDGFISRINVLPDGYGNSILINHENNYSSLYAHLHHFAPKIRSYAEKLLYRERKQMIEHELQDEKIFVKRGEYIGIMGNTGRSSAAHLHFEIRRTDDEVPINPFLLGFKSSDHIAPTINGISLYVISPDGEELHTKYFPAKKLKNNKYALIQDALEFGSLLVGVGLHAYDQMDGASNHNGIYGLEQSVDGIKNFEFVLNEMPFHQSQYIHSHMDFHAKLNNKYITKCFKNIDNPLPIYNTDEKGGLINLFETNYRDIHIAVRDFDGNKSEISFKIKRGKEWETEYSEVLNTKIRLSNKDSLFHDLGSASVELFDGTFVKPERIQIRCLNDSIIDLKQRLSIPIFKQMKISFPSLRLDYPKEKYLIVQKSAKSAGRQFSQWEANNKLVSYVRDFGQYQLEIDTIGPKIKIISLPSSKSSRIKLQLSDNFEPLDRRDYFKFEFYIDGEWKLCEWDIKNNTIWYDMPSKKSRSSSKLHVIVSDAAGNSTELRKEIAF